MSLALALLQLYVPGVVRKRMMDELFGGTAAAFGAPAPEMTGVSHEERLLRYALFTRDLAEQALRDGRGLPELRNRLHVNAQALGEKARREMGIARLSEVMAAGRVLYRVLGIEFCEAKDGGIEIPQCFFSRYYTGEICRLISALDEGMVAGLSQGGRLVFAQRLTEGGACCKARLLTRGCGG